MNKNSGVLIIGASSDLGVEVIKKMIKHPKKIWAHYFSHGSVLEEIKEKLQGKSKDNLTLLQADLSQQEGINQLLAQVNREATPLDTLLFLAAQPVEYLHFRKIEWENVQKDFDIQFKSTFQILQTVLPLLSKKKCGDILIVLSSVTLHPVPFVAHYTSLKFAVLGLMQALATEFQDKGIRINALSPSWIETKFLKNIPEQLLAIARNKQRDKKFLMPEEVAMKIISILQDPYSGAGHNFELTKD